MRQRGEEGAGSAMLDGVVRTAEARDLAGVLELYRDLHPEDAPLPPEPEDRLSGALGCEALNPRRRGTIGVT
ncbi:hypothetical protein WME98_24410 [Sorangium sp. So ce296]|uniref:hypothetical protein n=1 Tax=Sorangium sp. So ce296 TaxID=3133296 RepID=UPI003F5F3B05